jgi:hypothetical protein
VDRLRENTEVTISLPFSGRTYRVLDFNATVVALIETGAVLDAGTVDATVFPEQLDDVFLTFVHEGQLVGLKGSLGSRAGSLRFQVADGVQRRRSRYTRVDAELPVTVAREGGVDATAGTTVNVAPEGLLIRAALEVELGAQVEVVLTLPGGPEPLRLSATVVRHAGELFAVHFPGDPVARAAIAEHVVEQCAAIRSAPV